MNSVLIKKPLLLIGIVSIFAFSCSDKEDEPVKQDDFTISFADYQAVSNQCDIAHDLGHDLALTVSHNEAEDCSGERDDCAFWIDDAGLWLPPTRATIDISKLATPSKITVVFTDWCGEGCTRFFLYDASGNLVSSYQNTLVSEQESVVFNTNLDKVKTVAVSSCEGILESMMFNF